MEETYGAATSNVKYLNLSRSNIAFMKNLESYQQLEVLNLSQNHIEDISNIAFYQNLWKVDLSFNKITCLDGLTPFIALGCLNLSHNQISWSELLKIRHIQILDLMLFGNPNLEKEKLCRIHLIDSLPNVWMMDGKLVTASEHLEVEQLFKMAEEQGLALWHKLPKNKFFPSYLRHVQINGAFGKKACHLLMRFPQKTSLNSEIDRKRLKYLAYNMQGNLQLELNSSEKLEIYQNIFEELLEARQQNKESSSILFLLLLVSLEFHLPTQVIVDMLALTSLHKYGSHLSIDLFLLPRTIRCLVVILLLNAIKIDNEEDSEEGIYNDLFLYVYNNVPDLLKLTDHKWGNLKSSSSNSSYKDYRSLLSGEITQILLLVPSFYQHIKLKDPGLISLLSEATNEKDVCSVINDVFNNDFEQQKTETQEDIGQSDEGWPQNPELHGGDDKVPGCLAICSSQEDLPTSVKATKEEVEEDRLDSKQNSFRLILNTLIQKQLKVVTSKQLVLTPCEHLLNSIKAQIFDNNGISKQKQKQQRQESQDHLKYEKEYYENAANSRQEYLESSVFEKEERRCLRNPFRSFSARTNKSKCCFYNSDKELIKKSSSEEIIFPAVCNKQMNSDDTQQESKMKIIVNVDSKYIPNTEYVKMNSGSNLKYNISDFNCKEELLILNVDQLSERKNVFPLYTSQFVSKPKKTDQKTDKRKTIHHRPATTAGCSRNFSEVNIPKGDSEQAILYEYLSMIANGANHIQRNSNSILPQQQQRISSMKTCHQGIVCGYKIPSHSEIDVKANVEGNYVHLQSSHFWLANGRNVFEEQRFLEQRLKNSYIPGWKQEMDYCRPKTASKKHSHRLNNSTLRPSTTAHLSF